jgi:uncharacterized membrane protein (Fun14 family)
MAVEPLASIAATIGGGFFGGMLIGYAIKKIIKIAAIIVGLFFAGLTYLQYQQIVAINWDKISGVSENTVSTLANATTGIPGFNIGHNTAALAITNFGIPLTGSLSMGFAIGFMKG